MKKLLALLGLFLCFTLEAQEFKVDKTVICNNTDKVFSELKGFKESPIWTSLSPIEKSEYVFFFGKESGTWSLVQVIPSEGVACLVAFGETGRRVAL